MYGAVLSYDVGFDYIGDVILIFSTYSNIRQVQRAECQAKVTRLVRQFVQQAVKLMVSEPRPHRAELSMLIFVVDRQISLAVDRWAISKMCKN